MGGQLLSGSGYWDCHANKWEIRRKVQEHVVWKGQHVNQTWILEFANRRRGKADVPGEPKVGVAAVLRLKRRSIGWPAG